MTKLNGKKIKLVVIICFVVFAVIWLISSFFKRDVCSVDFPEGVIKNTPSLYASAEYSIYKTKNMRADSIPTTLSVPEWFEVEKDYLVGVKDDVTYIILTRNEDFATLMMDELPSLVNTPLFGYKPQYTHIDAQQGYFYDIEGEYRAAIVKTKISVREVTAYTVAYAIPLRRGGNLVFYASTKDPEKLADAEDSLESFAFYAFDVEDEGADSKEVEDNKNGENQKIVTKKFNEAVECKNSYFDGVCLVEWSNQWFEPEVYLDKHDGTAYAPMDKYSYPGHYVFHFGHTDPRVFYLFGSITGTDDELEQWSKRRVTFMELESYESLLPSDEIINVPDFGE